MSTNFSELWAHLQELPLFWLTITLVSYYSMVSLCKRLPKWPIFNPFLGATAILIAILLVSNTSYEVYKNQVTLLQFLMGPATVALAVPMYLHYTKLKQIIKPLLIALPIGAMIAIASVGLLGELFGLPDSMILSLLPKSVTTPIAMGVAEQIGGVSSLAAVFVLLTGMIGAVIALPLLSMVGIEDLRVRGFAMGLSAHGIGTARILELSQEAAAFSSLAMALNGSFTAIALPILLNWLF
jgi:predicted murein hydrolase (TIGR00659 family)